MERDGGWALEASGREQVWVMMCRELDSKVMYFEVFFVYRSIPTLQTFTYPYSSPYVDNFSKQGTECH